jgi:hypothetical protein
MRAEIQSLIVVNDEELLHQKFASRQVPSIFIALIVIGGFGGMAGCYWAHRRKDRAG